MQELPTTAPARQSTAAHPAADDAMDRAELAARADLAELLGRASVGDQEAWRKLVQLYSRRVFALAKSRVHRADMAEEITQSVFVTVASKLGAGQYVEQGRFESWLFRVAVNRIRDEIRRLRRHAEPTDPDVLAGVAGRPESQHSGTMERENELVRLRSAMASLSDADREVIELRHHAGLAFAEIAEILSEPLGTLLARHHRALRKLRSVLEGDGESKGES